MDITSRGVIFTSLVCSLLDCSSADKFMIHLVTSTVLSIRLQKIDIITPNKVLRQIHDGLH
jgi:hypothetical protein